MVKLVIETEHKKEVLFFAKIELHTGYKGRLEIIAITPYGEYHDFYCSSNEETSRVYNELVENDFARISSYQGNRHMIEVGRR